MAQAQTKKLDSGDAFPELALSLVDGKRTTVAEHARGKWGVVLLYRGDW